MPFKPANRCTQCRKLHNGIGLCRACRRITNAPYQTAQWEKLQIQVLNEEPICHGWPPGGVCGARSQIVDHIRPIRSGGNPYDRKNCQALCKPCHSRKTNEEQWSR